MTALIPVATPRFWWRTTAEHVRQWVPEDPDIEDGVQRHSDRDERRWNLIAAAVTQVGDALAAGSWSVDPELDDHGLVALPGYPGDLTQTEQDIISAWFRSSEAVEFDPWFEPLTNGRHRLWGTMSHFGAASIPIRGSALRHANSADAEVLGDGWPGLYANDIEELAALDWFDTRDPLNASFRASLVTAASGAFPSPVDPVTPGLQTSSRSKRQWWWSRRRAVSA